MQSGRVLIIEDDVILNDQVAELLRSQGFKIDQCHDGEVGLLTALREKFDLILLDVLLPTLGGFSVLNQLRQVQQTPVMMLTACGAEAERIEGYSKGADDYLPKPFNFTELQLRIRALLRRTQGLGKRSLEVLEARGLCLYRREQQVKYQDHDIVLTPIQFRLLWLLVENRGETLTKPYLYQAVLERSFSRYDRSLDMHLSRVRRKLEEAGMAAQCLTTVHGKGYLFAKS